MKLNLGHLINKRQPIVIPFDIGTLPHHEVKWCARCHQHKPIKKFSKKSSTPDGYRYWCKACEKTYMIGYLARKRREMITRIGFDLF